MSEQEIMEKGTLRSNEEVVQLLETVKDFVNQNFQSKGVVANVISQHEKDLFGHLLVLFTAVNLYHILVI